MRSWIYSSGSDEIVVHWDDHRCIHVEACIRAAPSAFDRHKRPWIDPTQVPRRVRVVTPNSA